MVKVARRAQGGEADLRFDRRAMLPERSAMATVAAVRAEIPSGTLRRAPTRSPCGPMTCASDAPSAATWNRPRGGNGGSPTASAATREVRSPGLSPAAITDCSSPPSPRLLAAVWSSPKPMPPWSAARDPFPCSPNRWAGGAIAPPGYVRIESFRLDHSIPVWTYAVEGRRIEHRIWMEPGANTTYATWRL